MGSKLTLQSDEVRLIFVLQMVLILGVGVAYLTTFGRFFALSAVCGCSIAMFNTWMLVRRVRLATKVASDTPGRELGVLYRGIVQRFAVVLALFIVGMAVFKLDPVAFLVGFAAVQGAFFLAAYLRGKFRFGGQFVRRE
jgi:F0F1-type ATP synthase assembly protein I